MATDVSSTTQLETPARQRVDVVVSSRGRWWTKGLLAVGLVGAAVVAITQLPAARSSRTTGPNLTYPISRGDLLVTVTEQGTLESSDNTEIKCKVRGQNTVTWVVESGTYVEPGDELLRLDTLFIEEQIAERTKYALWSRSAAERSKADFAAAELAVQEYRQGRFVAQLMTLQKDLAIAEANLRTSQNMLSHAQTMLDSGYVNELDVEERRFAVDRSKLAVENSKTQIEVLKNFTKKEQLETLNGNLAAMRATHEANVERAEADASRRDRALEELEYCVINAERSGMVIHPSAARWKDAPEVEEGASVHKDQILLLMPDLSKMQVKVGVHESVVARITPGLEARITLPDQTLAGEVSTVASVTSPAGWWTGNVVKYDTVIQLPSEQGLKPGMSAEVEIIIARHENVIMVPVAAVIETERGFLAWVRTHNGIERRSLQLGDSNDVFIVVKSGLEEGEKVVLNPLAFVDEAQNEVLKPVASDSDEDQRNASESIDKNDAAMQDTSDLDDG